MKIVDIHTTVVGAPWRELTFVELTTDVGLIGVAEVRIVNKTETLVAAIRELGHRYVTGSDPFDLQTLAWNIGRGEYGRAGEIAQSALAAFDVASYDLMGQFLDVPVWQLLGGRYRDRVPAYANGWYQAERSPDALAEAARRVTARGYRAMKIDPFGAARSSLSPAERRTAVELLGAVRDAVGPDIELFVEMHGRFTPAEAVRVASAIEELDPGWIEEPVPPENAAALRQVRALTRIPIATGERAHTLHDLRELLELGLVDIVQADLTHFGGLTPLRTLSGWADVHYVELAPHNVCGPVGTMAALHAATALPNIRVLEHFNDFADPWVQDLVDHAPTVGADGSFTIPTGPGLGVKLDHDACAEHPPSGGLITLFQPGWERRLGTAG